MSKKILNQKRFLGVTTLNWLRADLARDTCFSYWEGPHADLVSRNGFIRDYNQHHFNDNMAGFPDNISRMQNGYFWVAMATPRNKSLDRLGTMPGFLRKLIWRLPKFMQPKAVRTVWAMAFNEGGAVLADMQGSADNFFTATGVVETNGRLYMASVEAGGIAVLDITSVPKR
ncbi:hypothetical protein [Serratia marcescens]|uniref:hypothetical protein n=1 Tax=Serratia marcescens TaxID=615 RepID=UPI001EF81EDD|nr:hypothetical protein [Serratia marcescens]